MKRKHGNSNFNDPGKGFSGSTRSIVIALVVLLIIAIAVTYYIVISKYGSISNMFLGERTSDEAVRKEERV